MEKVKRFKPFIPAHHMDVKTAWRRLCRDADPSSALARLAPKLSDREIVELKVDPAQYSSSDAFRVDYLLVSYLSKYKGLKTGIDTEAVALRKFREAEEKCKKTNVRLRSGQPVIVDPILHRAQRLIARLLGPLNLRQLAGGERWGPGATTDLRRKEAYLDQKLEKLPISVTRECLPAFRCCVQDDLHWSYVVLGQFPEGPYSLLDSVFLIEDGSRVVTVPKNAKTDRTISIEPRGNMFMQKSVGRFIRKRLKSVGVDLDDQSWNQKLAAIGAQFGFATIDLSMASDSVTIELVAQLLPLEWYFYLDLLRSQRYIDDTGVHRFEKFSSMGNGFTFELESLIFWALVRATCDDNEATIAVYGDDLIVPSEHAWPLITVLAYCGFDVNDDKSFIEGPFRESCGRHFFDGVDVTPVYQKEVVDSLEEHVRFVNRLIRYAVKHNDGTRIDPWFSKLVMSFYREISHERWPQIPYGVEGDDGYLVNHEWCADMRHTRSYGYRFSTIRHLVAKLPASDEALLAYELRLRSEQNQLYVDLPTIGAPVKVWLDRRTRHLDAPKELRMFGDPRSAELDSLASSSRITCWSSRRIEPPWEFALDIR